MLYESRGSLVVYFGGGDVPKDAEWSVFVDALSLVAKKHGQMRIMVFASEGSPTPKQRRSVMAAVGKVPHRVAVVSSSLIAQGVATVLSWLGANIRVFSPKAPESAFAWVGATHDEIAWIAKTEKELRGRLELRRAG